MGKNAKILHQFINGLQQDLDDNAKKNDAYQKGVNGRIYSKQGVLSYSSVQGTVEVYNNDQIVKYLGYWSFTDSLVVFVKHLEDLDRSAATPEYEDTDQDVLTSDFFEINIPYALIPYAC